MTRSKKAGKYPWVRKSVERKAHTGRTESESRYNTKRWRTVSKLHLQANPLCTILKAKGCTVAADVTDHIQPVRFGGDFWNPNNHQALSFAIHDQKSGFEAQLMRLMNGLELGERKAAYEFIDAKIKERNKKQIFQSDFQEVKNYFEQWKLQTGYGIES